jgi:carbamoylphosphate synthase large subunit
VSRPRILFGDHRTQAPAIAAFVDQDRFDVRFEPFDTADFSDADLVVPLRIDQFAPARAANVDGRRRAVLPDPALLDLCDDKLAFNERLIALGFGAFVPALLGEAPATYPFVRKGRRGDFGKGIRVVRGPGEDESVPDSFAQVAVEGADEEVLHLLRVDGRIRFTLCYRYTMAGALAVRGEVDRPLATVPAAVETALEPCAAMLDALGFEGTCCFNYKMQDGRPMILELNPRFGGSLVGEVSAYLDAHLAAL